MCVRLRRQVCNSDHFGLLFTMRRVEKQGGVAA
jgi:hypothetical protein